jgi:hypothetical protein
VAAISILLDNGDLLERLARKRQLKFAIESMISEQYEPKMSPEWRAVWNGMGIGRDKIYFVEQYQKNQVGSVKQQPSTHLATLHPPRTPPPTSHASTHLATLHPPCNPPPTSQPSTHLAPSHASHALFGGHKPTTITVATSNLFASNLFASNLFIPKSSRCSAD